MPKRKKSFSDSYKKEMFSILKDLEKEEPFLKKSKPGKNQILLAKKVAKERKALSYLFFQYLIEDED